MEQFVQWILNVHLSLMFLLDVSTPYKVIIGVRGDAVGWGTTLQAGRPRFRFPMVSLEFFIDIILPVALWPWGRLSL